MNVSIATLNTIRTMASPMYQEHVPTATQSNISEVGRMIEAYDNTFNEYSRLMNKIALTITQKRMFNNKLKTLKSGKLETATTIEEYFIKKIKGKKFDQKGSTTLVPNFPSTSVTYYKENRQDTYSTTTSFVAIRQSFQSTNGVESYLAGIVAELYNSADIDEYEVMKNLLGKATEKACVYETPKIINEDTAKRFVKTLKKASNDMEEPTYLFHQATIKNEAGEEEVDKDVITFTPKANQIIFLNKDVDAEISVEVLAKAFNLEQANYPAPTIITGDFGTSGTDVYAIISGSELLKVFDTYNELLTQVNAQGAFTNHFLHIHQVLAISPYENMIVIKGK